MIRARRISQGGWLIRRVVIKPRIIMDQQILRHRRPALLSVAAVTAAATLLVSAPSGAQQPPAAGAAGGNAAVERGRYLVRITGCHDCHSPKIKGMTPDLDRALSGRPSTTSLPTPTKDEVHASPDLTAWQ